MNYFIHDIDPVLVSFGPLSINYYNLSYLLSFLIGYIFVKKNFALKNIVMSSEKYTDYIFYLILGIILGARLGYVFFYIFGEFIQDPLVLFKVWKGGMSFHGGCLGVILAHFLFCRKNKFNFYEIADPAMPLAAIGVGLVRIANFINGELYGRVTDLPWAVIFLRTDPEILPRHPSQLYESLFEGFLMAIFLQFMLIKAKLKGLIFWLFIGLYGVVRFLIEFIRLPDADLSIYENDKLFGIFSLSMGQFLSLFMIVAATVGIIYIVKKNKSDTHSLKKVIDKSTSHTLKKVKTTQN